MTSPRLACAPLAAADLDAFHTLVLEPHVRRWQMDGTVYRRDALHPEPLLVYLLLCRLAGRGRRVLARRARREVARMDPTIVVLGIRALLRIAREGQAAYEQYQRDKPVLFPSGLVAPASDVAFLRKVFSRHLAEIEDGGAYAGYWKGTAPDPAVPGAAEILLMRAVQLDAEDNAAAGLGPTRRIEVGGAAMIQQWAEGRGPVGPVGRMVARLADVALEFVGARPSLLGAGGNGEKMIAAVAGRLSQLIPDDADAGGPRSQLTERAAGAFLRAGLDALNERGDAGLADADLRALVEHTLVPLVAGLPGDFAADLAAQSRWRAVTDAVLAPAARVAVGALARNPTDAGDRAQLATALGALTRALVGHASDPGRGQALDASGLLALYRAAVGSAEACPALWLARPDPPERVAAELFAGVANVLRDAPPPFEGGGGAALAATAVAALQANGTRFAGGAEPWQRTVAAMVAAVVAGLRPALAGARPLHQVLSPRELRGLVAVVLRRAAATPGLLAPGRTELEAIMGAIGHAVVADEHGVLGPADWLAVADAVVEEAAANPGRVCPLAAPGAETCPASALIAALLGVAACDRDAGGVLFGPTLRAAIVATVRSGADAAAADAVAALATALNEFHAARRPRCGSREWLGLYRRLLPRVAQGTPVAALAPAALDDLLAERSKE